MRKWLLILLTVAALMAAQTAPAAESGSTAKKKKPAYQVGELTVHATKMDQEMDQLTDSVSVITEQEIKKQNFTDFTEVLRYTPGVEFKRVGGPGQYCYPKLRGFGNGHFLVVVDGMKINDGYSPGAGNFFAQIDPYLLERVEVLRGPQSVLYGSDTTAGVFALTTKGGYPGANLNLGGEYGSEQWKKGRGGIRGQIDKLTYSINFAGVDSDGVWSDEYYRAYSPQVKLSYGTDKFKIGGSFYYSRTKYQYAELRENYSYVDSKDEWWAFQLPDPEQWTEQKYHLGTLNFKHQITDNLRHKLVLGWYKKDRTAYDPDNGLLGYVTAPVNNFTLDYVHYYDKGDRVPVYDRGSSEKYYTKNENYMADYNLIWDKPFGEHLNTVLLGLEYYQQEGASWGRYGETSGRVDTKSVYLNDQLALFNGKLLFNAGGRFDEHSKFGSHLVGKVGAAYNFPTDTTLFANYGTSFRAPSVFQLYSAKYGNPNLDPEEGWTVEGGVRQKFLGGKFSTELTFWHTELDDVITFQYGVRPDGSLGGYYYNSDEAKTEGIEFGFTWWIIDQLKFSGNYTYTDSRSITKAGVESRTVQIARNKFNLNLGYYPFKWLELQIHLYYSGPRLRWRGDIEMDSYYRVDFAARAKLGKGFTAFGRVQNLFDEKIEEGLGYKDPGLLAYVGLEWDLNLLNI